MAEKERFERWYRIFRKIILKAQRKNGGWRWLGPMYRLYGCAMLVLVLQLPMEDLKYF
jgi:hypothetical protein